MMDPPHRAIPLHRPAALASFAQSRSGSLAPFPKVHRWSAGVQPVEQADGPEQCRRMVENPNGPRSTRDYYLIEDEMGIVSVYREGADRDTHRRVGSYMASRRMP
jgi:hypothetical protein